MGMVTGHDWNTIITMKNDNQDNGPVRGLVWVEHDIHDKK